MENNFEFVNESHNGKYYIQFKQNRSQKELDALVKELNMKLKSFGAKAFNIGDKIELHLHDQKLEEQLHSINKLLKEYNK